MAPIPKFATPPPKAKDCLLDFPAPGILLVTLDRPKSLNCINIEGHHELDRIWAWLDGEPGLTCGIITGKGRAFCAGADLKEWNNANSSNQKRATQPSSGFGGLSRRVGRKPIIAAVNGLCMGGGCEMIINLDLIIASRGAIFALSEVKRGVTASAGALPRLIRTVGKPRAMEMALTGRNVSADEAFSWGLINRVVGDGDGEVVAAAVEFAKLIAENSPDAVVVTREGIKMGWEGVGAEEGTRLANEMWLPRLQAGENLKEGVLAFVEKRKPKWKPSKL